MCISYLTALGRAVSQVLENLPLSHLAAAREAHIKKKTICFTFLGVPVKLIRSISLFVRVATLIKYV